MRIENAAHHHTGKAASHQKIIKAEFLECFCPADPSWRNAVIEHGLAVIKRVISH